MDEWSGPSRRAQDPDHPVGATARAIRSVLSEFQTWQVDSSVIAQGLLDGGTSSHLPPGFAEGKPGSYVRATRGMLMLKSDGSIQTMADLMKNPPQRSSACQEDRNMRISDVLDLTWMRRGVIELHGVEELLRRLVKAVLPETPVSFHSHDEPQYRSALRLQLADIRIPAAMGGVYYPWPEMPEGTSTAYVRIHLEPWATAKSGQVIELTEFSFPQSNEEPQPPSDDRRESP
jgi:hypothetical protein